MRKVGVVCLGLFVCFVVLATQAREDPLELQDVWDLTLCGCSCRAGMFDYDDLRIYHVMRQAPRKKKKNYILRMSRNQIEISSTLFSHLRAV